MTEKTALDVPFMEVNGELCKGCQLCLAVCPKSVIAISDKPVAACVSMPAPNRVPFA